MSGEASFNNEHCKECWFYNHYFCETHCGFYKPPDGGKPHALPETPPGEGASGGVLATRPGAPAKPSGDWKELKWLDYQFDVTTTPAPETWEGVIKCPHCGQIVRERLQHYNGGSDGHSHGEGARHCWYCNKPSGDGKGTVEPSAGTASDEVGSTPTPPPETPVGKSAERIKNEYFTPDVQLHEIIVVPIGDGKPYADTDPNKGNHLPLTPPEKSDGHKVFSRPECIFHYCPTPDLCKETCMHQDPAPEARCPHPSFAVVWLNDNETEMRCAHCFEVLPFFYYSPKEWAEHMRDFKSPAAASGSGAKQSTARPTLESGVSPDPVETAGDCTNCERQNCAKRGYAGAEWCHPIWKSIGTDKCPGGLDFKPWKFDVCPFIKPPILFDDCLHTACELHPLGDMTAGRRWLQRKETGDKVIYDIIKGSGYKWLGKNYKIGPRIEEPSDDEFHEVG